MFACIIVIESPRHSFAFVDDKIKLKLVGGTSPRIGSCRVFELRAVIAEFLKLAAPSRLDTRCAIEELRKFGERDRSLIIKAARRMVAQEPRGRRNRRRISVREPTQIDLFAGPAWPYRW
jgi:hypothetical protein